MKNLLMTASAIVALALASPALAQNASTGSQTHSQQSATSDQKLAAAQQIQQDLQKAGFTDVNVVAESFVVQAKSKNGDPVVMTIGPHGEAMNVDSKGAKSGSSSQNTTGSASPSQGNSKQNSK